MVLKYALILVSTKEIIQLITILLNSYIYMECIFEVLGALRYKLPKELNFRHHFIFCSDLPNSNCMQFFIAKPHKCKLIWQFFFNTDSCIEKIKRKRILRQITRNFTKVIADKHFSQELRTCFSLKKTSTSFEFFSFFLRLIICIFNTFSRSGKQGCGCSYFFKNFRLCTNPVNFN